MPAQRTTFLVRGHCKLIKPNLSSGIGQVMWNAVCSSYLPTRSPFPMINQGGCVISIQYVFPNIKPNLIPSIKNPSFALDLLLVVSQSREYLLPPSAAGNELIDRRFTQYHTKIMCVHVQFGSFIRQQMTFSLLCPALNTHTAHTSKANFGYQQ